MPNADIELLLKRDTFQPERTFGKLFVDGKYFCEVLEDADRRVEEDSTRKVYGKTAIPRGRYRVSLSVSQRWRKLMPEIRGVVGFVGVRFHGGNDENDTDGCPLLGHVRGDRWPYVSNCAGVNARLIELIDQAYKSGRAVWLTVE